MPVPTMPTIAMTAATGGRTSRRLGRSSVGAKKSSTAMTTAAIAARRAAVGSAAALGAVKTAVCQSVHPWPMELLSSDDRAPGAA